MMTKDEALKLVYNEKCIDACKEALAEQETQESITSMQPVALMYVNDDGECEQIEYDELFDDSNVTPLYTHPLKRLTDDEMLKVFDDIVAGCYGDDDFWIKFANAIMDKLGVK